VTDKQKKLLGFGGVGIAGVLIYMHMHSSSGASTAAASPTNSTATGSITPYTPQPVTTLEPGESVYDPNSQNLLTTPTPIDNSTGNVPGLGAQAGTAAAPGYSVNVNYPPQISTVSNATKPVKRVANPVRPKNVPANAVYSGNVAPGSNYKGVGAGWWVKK
jgi:hypothetical protein